MTGCSTIPGLFPSAVDCAAYVFGSLPPVSDLSQVPNEDWPVYVRHLVAQYGPKAVWNASLDSLNYPATWVRGAGEALAIERRLQAQLQSKGT